MTTGSKFLRSFEGEVFASPPIWFMRQAGRYLPEYRKLRAQAGTFLDLCFNPALASEVTLQPIRRFDLDAAILALEINSPYERLTIARLKKKKLRLKDQIKEIKDSMLPDIIA